VRYSVEYDITDLDHYYEFLGGLKLLAEHGKRGEVDAYWLDTSGHRLRIRELREAIAYSSYTRLLNDRWIEAMLGHGYDGVREIAKRVEYLLGLAATTHSVPEHIWHRVLEEYVADDSRFTRMKEANREAARKLLEKLVEAADRGYWKPSADERRLLAEKLEEL